MLPPPGITLLSPLIFIIYLTTNILSDDGKPYPVDAL